MCFRGRVRKDAPAPCMATWSPLWWGVGAATLCPHPDHALRGSVLHPLGKSWIFSWCLTYVNYYWEKLIVTDIIGNGQKLRFINLLWTVYTTTFFHSNSVIVFYSYVPLGICRFCFWNVSSANGLMTLSNHTRTLLYCSWNEMSLQLPTD